MFSYVQTGLPGLNQSKQGLMCLAQEQKRSDAGETQTHKHSTTEPLPSRRNKDDLQSLTGDYKYIHFFLFSNPAFFLYI